MRTSSTELEIGDYLSILRRRWVYFVVPFLAIPWLAFFLSTSQPDSFASTARVLLGDTAAQEAVSAGSQSTSFRNRLLENELRLATGDAAVAEVARRFDLPVDGAPRASVSAASDADILEFRATSTNPETAANVANAWAESYLALKQEQTLASIEGAVEQLEAKLVELQDERDEIRSDLVRLEGALARSSDLTREQAQLRVDREDSRISGQVTLIDAQIAATAASITDLRLSADLALGSGPRLITEARPASSPSGSSTSRNVVLGLVVGSILGAALALLRENLDTAVRTPDDLEELGLVHLGSIPAVTSAQTGDTGLASLNDPESPQAAGYLKVRSAIDFLSADRDLRSLIITSAVQGEGKTTTASNLATAMAQGNKRTILVDADLRRPRIHRVFKTKQSPGLTNVVLDPTTLAESAWPIPSLAESFVVVPSGALPPHVSSFISSDSFGSTLKRLTMMGDFTVIDAPPLLPVADTLTLSNHASAVLLVVDAGRTSKADVQLAADNLLRAGAEVIGAVLIGVKHSTSAYAYRYEADGDVERLTVDEAARTASSDNRAIIDLRDSAMADKNEATSR